MQSCSFSMKLKTFSLCVESFVVLSAVQIFSMLLKVIKYEPISRLVFDLFFF